jgi:hypothetical protein
VSAPVLVWIFGKSTSLSSACNGDRILQFPITQPSNYTGSCIFFFLDLYLFDQ